MSTIPESDDEIVVVLRTWFRSNPDPTFREEMRNLAMNPGGKAFIRQQLNRQRVMMARPFISDDDFNRLIKLLSEGLDL